MRLTRAFPLSEAVSLQVIGEVFNLLNRTNFKTVNGVVGNASIENLPANLVGRRGPVTESLSFASAFDPRSSTVHAAVDVLEMAAGLSSFERPPPRGRWCSCSAFATGFSRHFCWARRPGPRLRPLAPISGLDCTKEQLRNSGR